MFIRDDDLITVFEFIPRLTLAQSQSLVCKQFNKMAQYKMHLSRKHPAWKMLLLGRYLSMRGGTWHEPCVRLDDMDNKYKEFLLPLCPAVPENISGIQELTISHFSGIELVRFISNCVGHFLLGSELEIRYVDSLLECGDTERAEFERFMLQFHGMFNEISVFSYEHNFQMPSYLLNPEVFGKLRLLQLQDEIPHEHVQFLINWLHLQDQDLEQEENKKLQFRSANREFLDAFVANVRQRFIATSSVPIRFKVLFTFVSQSSVNQIEHAWNFFDTDQQSKEMLSAQSLFYPKMFELRRRNCDESAEEKKLDEIKQKSTKQKAGTSVVVTVFQPVCQSDGQLINTKPGPSGTFY